MMLDLKRSIHCILLAAALLALAGCSDVITPPPTEDTSLASVPTHPPTSTSRAIATVPFLTPVATVTPTVSPTPIIHVVQEGDALINIAYKYGVSVEAIQAANGIENPQFLRVGQELIIPTGEEETGTSSGLLLPTPTPMPFGVQGVAFYETPVGSLWCLGEIVNTTAYALTNVQVRVTLFNEAGERLAEADAFAAADLIPPGERSPFGILFTSPPPARVSSQVTIVRGEEVGELADVYVPIAVTEVAEQPAGPQFQVSGVVRNESAEQAAGRVIVVATTYDAGGLVTGFRQETIEVEEGLAPGATAPFTLLLNFHGDAPADFSVIALGRVTTE